MNDTAHALKYMHSVASIVELVQNYRAAMNDREDHEAFENAERAIHEDPLEIKMRGDWQTPGDRPLSGDGEFFILLSTGRPETRIFGELYRGSIDSAVFQGQDWFEPWRDVDLYEYEQMPNEDKPEALHDLSAEDIQDHLEEYANHFYWGD